MTAGLFIVRTPKGWYRENPGAPVSFVLNEKDATPVPKGYVEYLALCIRGPITCEAAP